MLSVFFLALRPRTHAQRSCARTPLGPKYPNNIRVRGIERLSSAAFVTYVELVRNFISEINVYLVFPSNMPFQRALV